MVPSRASALSGGKSSEQEGANSSELGARSIPTRSAVVEAEGKREVVVVQRLAGLGEDVARVEAELRAIAQLRHPNVARIREVAQRGDQLVVTSELIDGTTLGDFEAAAQRKGTPIPLSVSLKVLIDVLAGLGAVHNLRDKSGKALRLVHGDLTPANVVIGLDGNARLVQLAGGRAAAENQASPTVRLLAPEILLADEATDARADIYSAGVLLWEMLAGKPIFPESNAGAILTRHLSGRIDTPSAPVEPAWAAQLVPIAKKAIATDPSGRYGSAADLAAEIKKVVRTNLAGAPRVAALVKELTGDQIAARRARLTSPGAAAGNAANAATSPSASNGDAGSGDSAVIATAKLQSKLSPRSAMKTQIGLQPIKPPEPAPPPAIAAAPAPAIAAAPAQSTEPLAAAAAAAAVAMTAPRGTTPGMLRAPSNSVVSAVGSAPSPQRPANDPPPSPAHGAASAAIEEPGITAPGLIPDLVKRSADPSFHGEADFASLLESDRPPALPPARAVVAPAIVAPTPAPPLAMGRSTQTAISPKKQQPVARLEPTPPPPAVAPIPPTPPPPIAQVAAVVQAAAVPAPPIDSPMHEPMPMAAVTPDADVAMAPEADVAMTPVEPDGRKRRRGIVLFAIAACLLLLTIAVFRIATRGHTPDERATGKPTDGEKRSTANGARPTTTTTASTTSADTETAAATGTATAPTIATTSTATATAESTAATSPTSVTATPTATTAGTTATAPTTFPTGAPTHTAPKPPYTGPTAKPKPTYDPLGI